MIVHLPQSWPFASRRVWAMGICGWQWFHICLGPRNQWPGFGDLRLAVVQPGPTESMVCHVAGSLAVRCSYRFHSSSRQLSHGADKICIRSSDGKPCAGSCSFKLCASELDRALTASGKLQSLK
jgi:hypothetical protein